MHPVIEIIDIVSPVFLLIGVGYALGSRGFMGPEAVSVLSRLVFYVAAPPLLFRSAAGADLSRALDMGSIAWIALVTVLTASATYALAAWTRPERRGVIAQGVFRTNMVFVGLPVIMNAFGEEVLGPAAVLIGFMVPVYNLLAVLVLSLPHKSAQGPGSLLWKTAREVVLNPLILGSAGGMVFSALGLALPVFADRTFDLLGRIAMPLALLVVGAGLDVQRLRTELRAASLISFIKLIIYPALIYAGLRMAGVSGVSLQFPVLLMAAPTAVASHIMAREMGGDSQLSSAVVIGATLSSLFTITLWLVFFRL